MISTQNKQKSSRDITKLTGAEQSALKTLILGYGQLQATSKKSGVYYRSVKNIATNGSGEKRNVDKLKACLALIEENAGVN